MCQATAPRTCSATMSWPSSQGYRYFSMGETFQNLSGKHGTFTAEGTLHKSSTTYSMNIAVPSPPSCIQPLFHSAMTSVLAAGPD